MTMNSNGSPLGHFSISLAVKDIITSLDFYEKLGFKIVDGGHINNGFPDSEETKWRILACDQVTIGLFQGMFPQNILTFNPSDVRSLQKQLKAQGVHLLKEANENSTGPDSVILEDPDGNRILLDQH